MRWKKELTDEQRAALERADKMMADPEARAALRAAFAAPEPRTREGWVVPDAMDDRASMWSLSQGCVGSFSTRVLLVAIPADADAEAVERVRRAAVGAMPFAHVQRDTPANHLHPRHLR